MASLTCWQCGGSLHDVPRPIRRSARCPHCRAELHACRLCRHYRPGILGECDHDRAERVLDKTAANFCTHFRPRPRAHRPVSDDRATRARAELESLFGLEATADSGGPEAPGGEAAAGGEPAGTPAERARRELERLLGPPRGDED